MPPKRKASGAVEKAEVSAPKRSKSKREIKEENEVESSPPKLKKVVVKGQAPVDPECVSKAGVAHVYCDAANNIYDAMLNQTNVQFNNNKYYLLQLLEDDKAKLYSVWFRWGRVGKKGQSKLENFGANLDAAIASFCQKFHEKTKNDWAQRKHFVKVPGKYDLLEMDYAAGEAEEKQLAKKESKSDVKKEKASQLDEAVQRLLRLICDIRVMEHAVMEMQYDAKKAPLGRLTKAQIKAGYAALKEIEELIQKGIKSGMKLVDACNIFYTRIPHDFGMRVPPLITSPQDLKKKMELLEALNDIEIAMTIISRGDKSDENPLDSQYRQLHCDMHPLAPTDDDYKMVSLYLQRTHARTHSNYTMELLDLYKVEKPEEVQQFQTYDNRMLLWHGSRLANWMGILSQGLRIAPPEAPVTGYMFGKGVYFADMSSKSANYAYPTRADNVGILLLCEVALGKCHELLDAKYDADKLPSGMHSVKGLGQTVPDPKETLVLPDGVQVPYGTPVKANVHNPKGYTLNYNEYVVYNTKQIKMRYLLKIKFNFK